ncbi:MAG: hypothetical protein HY013_20295 [Candidatus Solibacter usitatus]|nr:hypothetical protein [Candidatus Solibacter usitatus]
MSIPMASMRNSAPTDHSTKRRFQTASDSAAASVVLTTASASPAPRPSFHCQAIRSRWLCPPAWLHTMKTAGSATRNSIAYRTLRRRVSIQATYQRAGWPGVSSHTSTPG